MSMKDLAQKDESFCQEMVDFYKGYYFKCRDRKPDLDKAIMLRIEMFEKALADHLKLRLPVPKNVS